ncbi:hypothetical protein Pint_33938 [Pistacia integerrima]|uniref:Uncharacterized protein n=1 Tax=Pistacia integerrima TaxID=434235 RepID=A0ACC0X4E3_9ROSI|nr:hypothetical protein Pint_33938 [Pistacia integerrima]
MVTTRSVGRQPGINDALNVGSTLANNDKVPLTTNQLGVVIALTMGLPSRNDKRIVDLDISELQMEFPLELINDLRNGLRDELLNLVVAKVIATKAQLGNLNNGHAIALENQNQNSPITSARSFTLTLIETTNGMEKLKRTARGQSTLIIGTTEMTLECQSINDRGILALIYQDSCQPYHPTTERHIMSP